MNQTLIKELIKYKLSAAEAIVNVMPSKTAEEIRNLGRTILESLNESCRERKDQQSVVSKQPNKLDKIPIE